MKQILENLDKNLLLPPPALQELEQHLAENYPQLSTVDHNQVVQQYLEKQVEININNFDDQYRPYIRRQLYCNVVGKSPGEVSGLDILKACLQANLDHERFYCELKQWLLSYPANQDLQSEASGLIALLRQMVKYYPEMTLEELIAAEQMYIDAATQVINDDLLNTLWGENHYGSLVPIDQVYVNSVPWEAEEKPQAPRFQKRIAFTTLGVAGFGLILLAGASLLMVSANITPRDDRQIKVAQAVPANPTPPAAAILSEVKKVEEPSAGFVTAQDDHLRDKVTKKARTTNRAYQQRQSNEDNKKNSARKRVISASVRPPATHSGKAAKITERGLVKQSGAVRSQPPVATSGKSADITEKILFGNTGLTWNQPLEQSQRAPESQTVIVGYTDVDNGMTITKVPLIKTYSNKLKLKANIGSGVLDSETATAETTRGNGVAIAKTVAVKGKTVIIDPKVIPSGSRVYIKNPPEYHDLDGVYIVEAGEGKNTANQNKIVLGDAAKAAKSNSGADQSEVEVYVLDGKE
jgi:3D (Asp-Asp-Asp) domain-containing protein